MTKEVLLQVQHLHVRFRVENGYVPAVSDFSCILHKGQTIAVIGESGCGKSVAAHAIMHILPKNTEISGEIIVRGNNLRLLDESALQKIRGSDMGILFQSPDRALNPLYRITRQIREVAKTHQIPYTDDFSTRLLTRVGCENPQDIAGKYPCQCSGGMNQRALLAIVSSPDPHILIADEPTKGLDNNRTAEVADALCKMRSDNRGILLITHDIALARTIASHVLVMYAGEIVEMGRVQDILTSPRHPYTRSLLMSLPENGFIPIPGMNPAFTDLPQGCRFAPRCQEKTSSCLHEHPCLVQHEEWGVRCLNAY